MPAVLCASRFPAIDHSTAIDHTSDGAESGHTTGSAKTATSLTAKPWPQHRETAVVHAPTKSGVTRARMPWPRKDCVLATVRNVRGLQATVFEGGAWDTTRRGDQHEQHPWPSQRRGRLLAAHLAGRWRRLASNVFEAMARAGTSIDLDAKHHCYTVSLTPWEQSAACGVLSRDDTAED